MTYMDIAVVEAYEGIEYKHGGPFGCVIVKDNEVVGTGHNKVLIDHDPTAHGEVVAIRNACKNLGTHDLSGCVLYTTGEPCPMCLAAIMWARIDKVVYAKSCQQTSDELGFDDTPFFEEITRKHLQGYCSNVDIIQEENIRVDLLFKDYIDSEGELY